MKLFRYKDKETPICYFETNHQIEIPDTYTKKEFRAMWVSNVVNIDMPIVFPIEIYQSKIIEMLKTAQSYNLTAIMFQVRTNNDAFYESKLNPYSRYFTGKEGQKPPFDVLKWIIEETKKHNIEFHAWCNPYRVSMNGNLSIDAYFETCDDLNFAKKNPNHILLDAKGQIILNPAHEAVKTHIINSMVELAQNYDIDGIHFDDYFYPYAGLDETKNDQQDYEKEKETHQSIGDFRRFHVSDMIEKLNSKLKTIKPNLRFGLSPFGIYKNKGNDPMGSNTSIKCSQSYDNQYADAYQWVKAGYIDYIVPQIYWEFGHPIAPFADICDWWVDVCKDSNVDLYIGHGAYRLGNEGEFENPNEITNQVIYASQYQSVKGHVFFTYKTFIDQEKCYLGMQKLKRLLTKGGFDHEKS
jgi:uncharacterized lipoprotein YddW (UPF0748 family)